MSASVLSYNLPGFGFTECNLYPIPKRLFDILEKHNRIQHMKETYQLGSMRYVYPGAHHTRYEYAYTQILITSNLKNVWNKTARNIEISLGSCINEFGAVNIDSKFIPPTGAEVIQCLALLNNASHLKETFTASRIMLFRIYDSKNSKEKRLYNIYKRNLPKCIRSHFDESIDTEDYYRFHLYNMIHLLVGYKRDPNCADLCDCCINILCQYICGSCKDSIDRVFSLYDYIRRVSYLSIDMIYTPAAFGLNLGRIIYSFPSMVDDLFDIDSPVSQTLNQLDDIIGTQIYNSAKSVLNFSNVTKLIRPTLTKLLAAVSSIHEIRDIISEKNESCVHFDHSKSGDKNWVPSTEIVVQFNKSLSNSTMLFEDYLQKELPYSVITGVQLSYGVRVLAFAIKTGYEDQIPRITQSITKFLHKSESYLSKRSLISIFRYTLKSLYMIDRYYITLSKPSSINLPLENFVFFETGTKFTAELIERVFADVPKSPEKHEILSCVSLLRQIDYRGPVICFVGNIKVNDVKDASKCDELDGLIYFPSITPNKPFCYIVEAKYYAGGSKCAANQLKQSKDFLANTLEGEIESDSKYAYMKVLHKVISKS